MGSMWNVLMTLAQTAPAATGTAPGGTESAAGGAAEKSLLDYINEGGTIGYVIILLSVVALAFAIAQVIQTRTSRLAPPDVIGDLDALLRAGDADGAARLCASAERECSLTRIFGAALLRCSRSPFGFLELRSALEEAGQEEVGRLQRGIEPIGLIASIAPMLGLLGTVVGMVLAFDTIAGSQGFARPDQLAGYISLALVTTVKGLVVAIPCTAAYFYLKGRLHRVAGEVAMIVEDLSSHLQTGTPAQEPVPARRPPAPGRAAGVGV